jgi:uncharacterized delta-60 repeat protein
MMRATMPGSRNSRYRRSLAKHAACSASLIAAAIAPAARAETPGSPDTTFGSGGSSNVVIGSWAGAAADVVQSNGKVVTAGEADINGTDEIVSTRMNANGALDPTYGNAGIETINVGGGSGVDSGDGIALQPDGKIVIAGTGYGPSGVLSFAAVRLLTNGTPDRSFGRAGIATMAIGSYSIANGVAIQPDGKIVLGGTALVGHDEFAAARLNANGTLDTSFGNHGIATLAPTGGAWGLALQSNGSIVLGGQTNYNNTQAFMAARLLSNGQPDTGFGTAGIVTIPIGTNAIATAVTLQNGNIILAGSAATNTAVAATVRLTSNGSLDTNFGTNGISTVTDYYGVNDAIVDSQGRILLACTGGSALRLNSNGTPDTTFGQNAIALVLLDSTGQVAPSGVGASDAAANGIAIDPTTDEIVLGGVATVNGQSEVSVIRLNP